jgi:hypothetical protein
MDWPSSGLAFSGYSGYHKVSFYRSLVKAKHLFAQKSMRLKIPAISKALHSTFGTGSYETTNDWSLIFFISPQRSQRLF